MHRQFKKDVDDLMQYGYIRRYTAEIKEKTRESTGNISNYYNGVIPISDNFLKKFKKAYGRALKKIRPVITSADHPLATNKQLPPPQGNHPDMPPNTTVPPTLVSDLEPQYSSNFEKQILERFTAIEKTLSTLVKDVADLKQKTAKPKPPRKPK